MHDTAPSDSCVASPGGERLTGPLADTVWHSGSVKQYSNRRQRPGKPCARSYFLKDVKGRELVDAIRAVHAGQRLLPQEIASCLAERIPRPELSPRELEILKLIANGESNKEIAGRLAINERTVRVHASNVFSKLGCSDRAQAVAVAFHRGIISIE